MNTIVRCYGSLNPSKEAKKEAWAVILALVQVMLDEFRTARIEGAAAFDHPNPTLAILLASLRLHRVMDDFKEAKFREHPRLFPKLLSHLQESTASKSSYDGLVGRVEKLEAENLRLKGGRGSRVATIEELRAEEGARQRLEARIHAIEKHCNLKAPKKSRGRGKKEKAVVESESEEDED